MKKSGQSKMKVQLYEGLLVVVIIVVIVVLILAVRSDKKNIEKTFDNTLTYLKSQCLSYDEVVQADKIKSLVRLTEQAVEVGADIHRDSELIDSVYLKNYTEAQRMAGIIILDEDMQPECQYSNVGLDYDAWKELIQDKKISEITKYSKKIYAERIQKNEKWYDLAAISRTDSPGVVFCYCYQDTDRLTDSYAAVNNLLAGYAMNMNGTLFIAADDKIYGTNDAQYENCQTTEIPVIQELRSIERSDNLVYFTSDGHRYCGGKGRYRDYNLYVYYPQKEVFAATRRTVLLALCISMLIWAAATVARNKSGRVHMRELNEQLKIIEAQQKKEVEYQLKLKQSMEEAVRANIAKTDFLRRMSHDIRTPINGIRGMVEIGRYYKDDLEKQSDCREKVWEASGFLLDLVNDVLDMNKLESGQIQLSEDSFDLQDILNEVTSILTVQAKKKNVCFYPIQTQIMHWHLIGSPLHLRQILLNIMGNAIKYNKEGGSVTTSVTETESTSDFNRVMLEFICQDTGIGMSKDFQEHMFEPFAQEKEMMQTVYSGTGLGLPIVKKIVEVMQGTIDYTSEKGKGTTFVIRLPFQVDKKKEQYTVQDEEAKTVVLDGMKVLLAEDNVLNMEIADFICENEGMIVTKAWNGKEALELFEQAEPGTFDIILMDLMMPVMSGLETAKNIRSLQRSDAKTIPIIAMTANAFSDDVADCKAAGMNEHVSKPLDADKLIETIAKYVSG